MRAPGCATPPRCFARTSKACGSAESRAAQDHQRTDSSHQAERRAGLGRGDQLHPDRALLAIGADRDLARDRHAGDVVGADLTDLDAQ